MTASLGAFGYLLTPGPVMMACGLLLFFLRGVVRDTVVLVAPLGVLALVWLLPEGQVEPFRWLGYELVPFRSDALSRLFATVFSFTAFAAGLFALRQERLSEIPVASGSARPWIK
jgi:formate hydrogenlyase subunit 3/multisubunit Na+/H+ antiporter MnhD subunit